MQVIVLDYVKDFLETLELDAREKSMRCFQLLTRYGRRLGPPHAKHIEGELYELRVIGRRSIRILYAFCGPDAYAVHAFIKKGQKLKRKDISLARARTALLQIDNI